MGYHCTNERAGWPASSRVSLQTSYQVCRRYTHGGSGSAAG